METKGLVFQVDSEIVENTYYQNLNYLIEFSENPDTDEKYCIIYFSSHDIYFPNDEQTFKNEILKKNKFEWYNTRISKGGKHIFIRDIKKQWYLTGINHKINNIEKLFTFLETETFGYKIITLGSSAGGYAAVLFGSMLNAETIFTFNGQFMLSDLLSGSCKVSTSEMVNPIIFREQNNPEINKYYSLRPFIKNPSSIYYFHSTQSEWDVEQYNHISDFRLQFITFNSNRHGVPFLKTNLNDILNIPVEKIQVFVGRINNPIIFSIKIAGLYRSMKDLARIAFKIIIKKIYTQKAS